MKTGIKVGDIMTRNFIYCHEDDELLKAVKIMAKNRIGSLIIKEKDKLLGIITERDIMMAVAKNENLKGLKVKDVMTKRVETISPNKDLYDAIIKMKKKNIRRLPVVEKGKVIGLVTWKDIIKIAPTLFDLLVEEIRIREESEKLKKLGKEEEYYEEYLK